ncbi:MAG: hypothetical protein JWQ87_1269 [Candidatus Sulfotelmatobacter sp.]|nr:hypothetical protein [Candidatus Sulfotelmatobacter sp.]
MGLGPRQTQTAALPPGEFHCLLDELPLHLIPRRRIEFLRARQKASAQPLFFNPRCLLLSNGNAPPELEPQRHLLKNFDLRGMVAWVTDPAMNAVLPFWLGRRLEFFVSRIRPGGPVPDSVPEDARFLLETAGILTREDDAERRIAEWNEVVKKSGQEFREKGYAVLGNLIHPFHLAALRRYYRHAVRHKAFPLGDEQCPLRYGVHNESVARFFHHQIARALCGIVGEAIKPSYVYLASYMGGAELTKHKDREQCEFSVTFCLDFSPEPELATSWPIRLDTPEGTVTVYQALGDGLAYRGTRLPHYRHELAEGNMSTSIFFHYVAADFSGRLE